MRRLRVFLGHELATQIRSARFHGVTLAYLAVATAPVIVLFVTRHRMASLVSPSMYGSFLDGIQPLVTTLFAAVIAVDGIARERDENSLGVVAMSPISATGYVLHRWLALVCLLLPVTLMPRVVAIGLFAMADRTTTGIDAVLLGWLLRVAPLLLAVTAISMALGTITGRVVLALIVGLGIFTVGFGIVNDLLAYAHRQIAGAGDFFGLDYPQELIWTLRGFVSVDPPTAAGYPLAQELDDLLIRSALTIGIAALLLGLSCAYLRRTKRDIRPWTIRDDHPLRSFLRTLNRFREEFTPDGGLEIPERIAIALGVLLPVAALVMITQRYERFEALAAERFAAHTEGVAPLPVTILPVAATLRGRISRSGDLVATATLTMRNDGAVPQRELAFALNRGLDLERVSTSRGAARVHRVWERLGVTLDPPLAPRESRSVTFAMRGAPGAFEFELPYGTNFDEQWRRYANGKLSIELADLSRSTIIRDATAERMIAGGSGLVPVPRYSTWEIVRDEWRYRTGRGSVPTFMPERFRPPTALSIELEVAESFTVVDVCGTVARSRLSSRCTHSLADYGVLGARYDTLEIAPGTRLLYLPPHAALARTHATAIASAIQAAKQSWPTFSMPERSVFVERPSLPGERSYREWEGSIQTIGAMNILSERMITRRRPLSSMPLAASLIAGDLYRRRTVSKDEQSFFRGFYSTIAEWRLGGHKPNAVEPAFGGKPMMSPIVGTGEGGWRGPVRLEHVLADIDHRIGTDRLIAGVEEFLAAGPEPGTAKELVETIGRRGGLDLGHYYEDYFVGTALPRLTLADVTITRVDDGWEVRGAVKNVADGEVFCPVVLRTAGGAVRTSLRVTAHSSTPFVLRTRQEPRTVQLDPEKVVYRHAAVGTIESVDFKEKS